MSRITTCWDRLAESRKKALLGYVVAGDLCQGPELWHALVAGGVNILEIGMPFSDPMAEGPVIQRAHERALGNAVGLRQVLQQVQAFRDKDSETPVVLMGYLNPIEAYGYTDFVSAAKQCGIDAVLIVDFPAGEISPLEAELERQGIDRIHLIAPTTTAERYRSIVKSASGFVYAITLRGITGAAGMDEDEVKQRVLDIQKISKVPVVVGFGIKSPEDAARLAQTADGVVIGSELVRAVSSCNNVPQAEALLQTLAASYRVALDGGNA